jgi:hypothetical protein
MVGRVGTAMPLVRRHASKIVNEYGDAQSELIEGRRPYQRKVRHGGERLAG